MSDRAPCVVIVGGGFGGVAAAPLGVELFGHELRPAVILAGLICLVTSKMA
jgi:hypothetical protein